MPHPQLILRFRDLATANHATVRRHAEILHDQPHEGVWWGWWHKHGEVLPVDSFYALTQALQAGGPQPVLLFDSGHLQLHRALLAEVRWAPDRRAMPAPGRRPDYYAERACLAWFRLVGISVEPLPELQAVAALQGLAYAPMPDLLDPADQGLFLAFHDKGVASLRELKGQDRTLWRVRPRRETDSVHEILANGHRDRPVDFRTRPRWRDSTALLWASDLHLPPDDAPATPWPGPHHAFPPHSVPRGPRSLRDQLVRLGHHAAGGAVAGVVVTGDISNRGDHGVFAKGSSFPKLLTSLVEAFALDPQDVVVCPGNHDFGMADLESHDNTPSAGFHPTVSKAHARGYARWYCDWYSRPHNAHLSQGQRFVMSGRVVDVVALNSALVQQSRGYRGLGFLGEEALEHAAREMGWERGESTAAVRLVMLHHHVVPLRGDIDPPHKDIAFSLTHDAGRLLEWCLDHGVTAVLHGHKHRHHLSRLAWPASDGRHGGPLDWRTLHVVSMGSAGQGQRQTAGFVRVLADRVEVSVYDISPQTDGFPLLARYPIPLATP